MAARKNTQPDDVADETFTDDVADETFTGEPAGEALPPADETGYAEDAVELEVEEVVHTVQRPGGLTVAYIKGADGVVRREYVDAGELEPIAEDGDAEAEEGDA